jgi:hypothetical protein
MHLLSGLSHRPVGEHDVIKGGCDNGENEPNKQAERKRATVGGGVQAARAERETEKVDVRHTRKETVAAICSHGQTLGELSNDLVQRRSPHRAAATPQIGTPAPAGVTRYACVPDSRRDARARSTTLDR